MPEAWKQWEGRVVNEEFPLVRYLGGSERSAVFLTKRADRETQEVAIKLILANAKNPELQLSWWELAAKLSHPHLLRLFQRGRCQLDGTELLYVVTEYAEESLAQILPHRPLTPVETRDMLQSVLDATAYLHAKGFVHGHIKPTNIMAVGDEVKISSDGLCGTGESSRVLGTRSIYASPETADGGGMSPASDVWSLGMMLVEALTQHPPAEARPGSSELVLPTTLPEPFFDIASHCLRRNPQSRSTVPEIAAKLQQAPRALPEKEVVLPPKGFTKWGYVGAAVAAVLLLAIVGPRIFRHHSPSETGPSSAVQSSAEQAESKPRAGQAAQPSLAKPQPSVRSDASHAADKPRAAKNAATNHSSGPQGAVVQQISADVSRSALRTIHGKLKVRVKVTVDSSGQVTAASFDSRGPSRYFAERTLRAAKQWTFQPPQVDGRDVPSEWLLNFEFERSGASIRPAQIFP
jgi:TonB family protein